MGLIYKITNKVNNKSYIGQTTQTLEKRWKKHLSQLNDNTYFHRAIKKYGANNFLKEILEDNIFNEKLDEREIYWIAKEGTYIDNGGYNLTVGGKSTPHRVRKLSDIEIKEIKKLLKDTKISQKENSEKFNVDFSTISDINVGDTWFDENCNYPLRENNFRLVEEEQFYLAIEMLKSNLFSETYISEKLNISRNSVHKINLGIYTRFEYPEIESFPLLQKKIVSNTKVPLIIGLKALKDILSTSLTRQKVADKYNVSLSYLKGLITNSNNKTQFQDLIFPLREHKEENLQKINEKIELLNRFS